MEDAQPTTELANQIIEKTLFSGASLAGIASVEELKTSPSHDIYPKIGPYRGATAQEELVRTIEWPEDARSALVFAIAHPAEEPSLDWWDGKAGTPGNRLLIKTANRMARWLREEQGIKSYKLPYHVEHGGIFLKDAAVLAGLGCIGRNNLLLTPDFGPQVRLRAMLLDRDLPPSERSGFDPCNDCPTPCRAQCPRSAFNDTIYSAQALSQPDLPGIDGSYSRDACDRQMQRDMESKTTVSSNNGSHPCVKYCRACEFACVLGAGTNRAV